jgi:hypothetical protein
VLCAKIGWCGNMLKIHHFFATYYFATSIKMLLVHSETELNRLKSFKLAKLAHAIQDDLLITD